MKNTTGMWDLQTKKGQLNMKITLIHILSDPNNHITQVDLHNEIEDVPYNGPFDFPLKERFTKRKTLTKTLVIELDNEPTDTKTTSGTAKRTKDSD